MSDAPSTLDVAPNAKTPARKGVVVFFSTEPETHAIEIILGPKHGESIKPDYTSDGRLRYRVPLNLAERFARHTHVQSGRIKKAR